VLEAVTPDHIVTTPDALLRLLTGRP
jgi:hypothetical protein